jgi:hypothetical protein
MKLIIAGGREVEVSCVFIHEILKVFNLNPREIVSGGARGIDRCGEQYVKYYNDLNPSPILSISSKTSHQLGLTIFEADWEQYGKAAGPIRNGEMAQYADALLLIWDGESKGSANMKFQMEQAKKPIYEVVIRKS